MSIGILQDGLKGPSDNQKMHQARITEACELLRLYMHEAEGSGLPSTLQEHEFMGRSMKVAATYLEIVEFFAVKAALE